MNLLFMLFAIGTITSIILAWWKGGRDERLAAMALLAAAFASIFLQSHRYSSPEMTVVFVDIGLFAALLGIALMSRSFWPIWAAGFQLCAVAVHLAAAKSPSMLPATYADALAIWTFPVLGALILGTWHEGRMRHGNG